MALRLTILGPWAEIGLYWSTFISPLGQKVTTYHKLSFDLAGYFKPGPPVNPSLGIDLEFRAKRIHWAACPLGKKSIFEDSEIIRLITIMESGSAIEQILGLGSIMDRVLVLLGHATDMQTLGRKASFRSSSNTWFTNECKIAKVDLRKRLGGIRLKGSMDWNQVTLLRKEYKKLVKNAKKAYQDKQYEELTQAAKDRNYLVFWRLVSGSTKAWHRIQGSVIASEDWVKHFEGLYNTEEYVPLRTFRYLDTEGIRLPLENDIKRLIHSLKSGKAPGPDAVPPV